MGRSKKKSMIKASLPLSDNEMYMNLEIDIQALRGKNKELVDTVTRVQKEKGLLQKQINLLQKEYFSLNSKYVNLRNIFTTIDSTAKLCFPKVAEVVNQIAKIMHVCTVGAAITNSGDLKTQAVSPHTVNGTVIKSPIITLARFSGDPPIPSAIARSPRLSNSGQSPPSQTSNVSQNARSEYINNNQATESGPSTSSGFSERLSQVQNDETNVSNRENQSPRVDFVNRYRRIPVPFDMEEETEDENNLEEEVAQDIENGEEYCPRLVTIEEESDENYHDLDQTNSHITEETVREIRIYLNPIHNIVKDNESSPNNSAGRFSYRTSSLSAEASDTMTENTILNESHRSPNKLVRFSDSNKTNEKSSFYLEDSNWRDNGNDSFTFTNISSIPKTPNVRDTEPSCSADLSEGTKLLTMESLGLRTTIEHQLATSTPVVASPRTRLSRKSSSGNSTKNVTVFQKSTSTVTKRKNSEELNVAQVVIKRFDLDKSNSIDELTKRLNVTPITSPRKIKSRKGRQRIISPSSSSSESSYVIDKTPKPKKKMKGKENKKILETTVQVTKSSPRPKRNAKPVSLREPSLIKKMRRSR